MWRARAGLRHRFSYQGRLVTATGPATGTYQFEFNLWNASNGGSKVAGPVSSGPIVVTDGFFTVSLDFGPVFQGDDRFLEIQARLDTGGADWTTFPDRQRLTPRLMPCSPRTRARPTRCRA